jgi:hypothetical protein
MIIILSRTQRPIGCRISISQWFSMYDKIDSLLIRFINERYKTGVSLGDFKSRIDIIDYILDKEQGLIQRIQPFN